MVRILLALALFCVTGASVTANQIDTLKYRISFTDKKGTPYSINKPEDFLSAKSIERRNKQGVKITETDLPVSLNYINEVKKHGINIILTGKWDNFVTISTNDLNKIDQITKLPFVKQVELVWKASESDLNPKTPERNTILNQMEKKDNYYGVGEDQIKISNGDKLHEAGFKGQGMTIAVIDAGYHNMDLITGMKNINVLGTKDFVNPNSDIYAENSHGMSVLSCIAMNQPYYMVGTAPEASFWLLRSEDESSEHLVEQDYWAAAVEFADSVGVDIVSTSLGYNSFDDASKNYEYRNLDGKYSLMSRQASLMASKGLLLVCSAGNSGSGPWKKITVPGDATDIITVGAIGVNGVLANFSSIGNTADNRVKPDVVAVGFRSSVMGTDGNLTKANGTSFSGPTITGLMAILWQSLPNLTVYELIDLVHKSSDRSEYPDNIYGYGVPDVWKAYQTGKPNQ